MKLSENDNKILKKIQQRELEILCKFNKVCRDNNIKYSLAFGTLIGAIRHKGFIPWDDDIDVIMTRGEYNKFLRVAKSLPEDLFLQNNNSDNFIFDIFMPAKLRDNHSQVEFDKTYNSGIFIDIFVLDGFSSNNFLRQFQRLFYLFTRFCQYQAIENNNSILNTMNVCKIMERLFLSILSTKESNLFYVYWIKKEFYLENEDLFPLKEITFEKKSFYIIKNYDFFLKGIYGDYMKLPPAEERVCSHIDLNKTAIK